MGRINFFNEGIRYKLDGKKILKTWIDQVITNAGYRRGTINFILTNDDILLEYNLKYLRHNTLTDIITFPLVENEHTISGDVFISIDRVYENAIIFKQSPRTELCRVLIHGVLHLLGNDDKTVSDKRNMRILEDEALKMLQANQDTEMFHVEHEQK